MAKKDFGQGMFFIAVGLLVIFTVINIAGPSREAMPQYDGIVNDFKISLTSHTNLAVANEMYHVTTEIQNVGTLNGTMYVQCSVLDRKEHPFLYNISTQAVVQMTTVDGNCVPDEPETQTALVSLAASEKTTTTFTVLLPNKTGGDYAIYCAAFEQCWSNTTPETYTSAELVQPITIYTEAQAAGVSEDVGNDCATTPDCKNWMFWKEQTCINGYCVDVEAEQAQKGESVKLDNATIEAWAGEHSLILILAAALIVIIGISLAYKKPKAPRYY